MYRLSQGPSIDLPTANHFSPMLRSVTSINKQFIQQTANTIGLHYSWNKDRTCSREWEYDLFYQGRYMWPMQPSLSGFITVSSEHRSVEQRLSYCCAVEGAYTSVLDVSSNSLWHWFIKSQSTVSERGEIASVIFNLILKFDFLKLTEWLPWNPCWNVSICTALVKSFMQCGSYCLEQWFSTDIQ